MFTQARGEYGFHAAFVQLVFELHEELVHHAQDDLAVQRGEGNDRVQAVAEFGREHAADFRHFVAHHPRVRETDRRTVQGLGPRVRRHDEDDVAEVSLAAIVVGQCAVVHDLQQDVEDIRVRLFDFIEQQHAVRLLGDGFGKEPALVEPHVARRRADQARHRVAFHVLRHIEAQQLHAQRECQLAGHFGLAHARGTGKQESADRLFRLAQARPRHLDGRGQRIDGAVLAKDHGLQVAIKGGELAAVVVGDGLRRDARDLGYDIFDVHLADHLFLARTRQQALGGAGLVDHVDGLVGQVAVVDEAGGQLRCGRQRGSRIAHAVVLFEATLQAAQNLHGLFDAGLGHVDLLEPARQRMVLFEDTAVFGVRGGADALELAGRQGRLEQIGRVQRAARSRTGADQRMDFVDEQNGVGIAADLLEHTLQTLFEIAAVFGARQQSAHVQRKDLGSLQDFRHFAARDAPGQAFGDGGLAHAGLADQQRIVLAAAAQHLDDAFDFVLATDQGIDAARKRGGVQVGGVLVQRRLARFALLFTIGLLLFLHGGGLHLRLFGNAMRQEVDDIEPCHALLLQVVHGMRVLFAEYGHQHVRAGDRLLAGASSGHMHDRALDHALKTQRRLRVDFGAARDHRRVFRNELAQVAAQVV
ncbi:hypothetical protein D3C87_741790 [compost metagenome]